MGVSPIKGNQNREQPFQEIQEEDRVAPFLAQDAKHIGRPDVPATLGADIDAAKFARKKTEGNRSQQIGTKSDQKPRDPRLENHPTISSVWR